jgi:hypothetical protein
MKRRRSKKEQRELNAEIDRRLIEFQSPKEIDAYLKGSMTNAFLRSHKLGLVLHRITDEERDFLLVRRKTATGGTTP